MATEVAQTRLPVGTVTFLFTDVEGSTPLWERHPEQMRGALARHDQLIEDLTRSHHGQVVRPRGEGDSRFCVFARATDALAAAAAIQRALRKEPWPPEVPIRVRIALHTGEADLRDGDYYGSAVNRAARLRAIAHGGQTLLSMATEELVRDALPDGIQLHDLGDHRLKDLQRPERVFQLTMAGAAETFPPPRSLDTLPNNLPLQVTSFVGREAEMAEVARLLEVSRLLTLTGPGGTGKTRLSLQVAADALEDHPDGVWLAELAPIANPELAAHAVAAALGVREEPGRPLVGTLLEWLRPKRLLLVLDNCEHLVAAAAQLADRVIRMCPRVRVLATSREALGIAGEVTWRVPSLALPHMDRIPAVEQLTQYEAVRLFIDRAKAVAPSFAVTDHNAPAVAQICHRLDGIPLAIELAAARLRGLPVDQLLARLEDRFRLLTGGSRTALERHQTLQALVDWSYGLLSESERTLFNRLAVFAGGFMLEAAEAVCEGGAVDRYDVFDVLTHLVDKSLVQLETLPDGGGRYRLLETLRHYAREKLLAAGEAAALFERHAAYYLAVGQELGPRYQSSGGAEKRALADQLQQELPNLRAALRWLTDQADATRGMRLLHALHPFLRGYGHASEGLAAATALLALPEAEAGSAPHARIQGLEAAAALAWARGDLALARRFGEEAVALARQADDQRALLRLLGRVAVFAGYQSDLAAARAVSEERLAIARALGDLRAVGQALMWLANISRYAGDYARARALLDEARQLGPSGTWAQEDLFEGMIANDLGDHARAEIHHRRMLAAREAGGDVWELSECYEHLGRTAHIRGDLHHAKELLETCLRMCREIEDAQGTGCALTYLSYVAIDLADVPLARGSLDEALVTLRNVGDRRSMADALDGHARLAAAEGAAERAVRLAGACDAYRASIGCPRPPVFQRFHERWLAPANATLDLETRTAIYEAGKELPVEQAIALALRRDATAMHP